jgi:flagellar motor switch protein FliM
LLLELSEVGFGNDGIDPSAYDVGAIEDLHTAGLVMTQGSYHIWRISIQVGGGDRQGEIMIAVRAVETARSVPEQVAPQ